MAQCIHETKICFASVETIDGTCLCKCLIITAVHRGS